MRAGLALDLPDLMRTYPQVTHENVGDLSVDELWLMLRKTRGG